MEMDQHESHKDDLWIMVFSKVHVISSLLFSLIF